MRTASDGDPDISLPTGGWEDMINCAAATGDKYTKRIDPPCEGELFNHVLSDAEYCWVMVFPNEAHSKFKDNKGLRSDSDQVEWLKELKDNREDTVRHLLRAGLSIRTKLSWDEDEYFVEIGAPQRFLEYIATKCKMPIKCVVSGKDGVPKECFKPFNMAEREKFVGMVGFDWFAFRTKPRLQLVNLVIHEKWAPENSKKGAGLVDRKGKPLPPSKMLEKGLLLHFFPRHEQAKLDKLGEDWANFSLMYDCSEDDAGRMKGMWNQPLDQIAAYFGEKLAMYFKFLGFYTSALVSPSLWGFAAFLIGVITGSTSLLTQWADVAYSIQIMVWATFMLENWKRSESEQAFDWGMRNLSSKEQSLPAFVGEYDEILECEVHSVESEGQQIRTFVGGSFLVFIIIVSVAATMAFYTALEAWAQKNYAAGSGVSVLNAISIIIFNALYKLLAAWLTENENHRTESEFQNNLTVKCFMFQFINSYFTLYLVAFAKPFAEASHPAGTFSGTAYPAVDGNMIGNTFGTCSCKTYAPTDCFSTTICNDIACSNVPVGQCACTEHACRADVGMTLLTLFGVQIFIGNVTEVMAPRISAMIIEYLDDGGEDMSEQKSTVEKEAAMANYEEFVYAGLFDDYNEIALQFGFVTLFASNFPLVGLLAMVNNMIEIRSDAYKFLHSFRRPTPRPCDGIGSWYMVMEVMTFAAVSTNCANIFIVSELSQSMSWSTRIVLLFAAEHLAFMLKLLIALMIPDVKSEVQREIDYEEAHKEKALNDEIFRLADMDFSDEIDKYLNVEIDLADIPMVWPEAPTKEEKNSISIKVEGAEAGAMGTIGVESTGVPAAEEAPVEEAPVEEAPVEEAPVEEAQP